MDVRCERCGTEYEFDDALVSDRGTSVKCTECGSEFRVLPRGGLTETGRPDAWHVTRVDGTEITYTSLRDLQRAIRRQDILRDDRLRREGQTASRALGSIPELEELLRGAWHDSTYAPIMKSPMKSTVDTMRPLSGAAPAPTELRDAPPPSRAAAIPARVDTLRPEASLPPVPVPAESDAKTLQRFSVRDIPAAPVDQETSSPLPPLANGVEADDDEESESAPGRESLSGVNHAPISFDHPMRGRKRRVGGWIVSFVLLGGVAVVGFVVARPYLVSKRDRSTAPLDARANGLLSAADKAYGAGNLDLAKEDVDKASALADGDPAVMFARAKVADARADLAWLRLRLLPADATDDVRTTTANATELASTADSLATAAMLAAPTDLATIRVHIDALRLIGKTSDARAQVTQLAPHADHAASGAGSSDPETAYVLAALDVAEPLPPWRTVIERLRSASSAEGELGRARSLLAYSLAKSGDLVGARTEVDKMALFARPHPLTPLLRAFVQKQQGPSDGGVGAGVGAGVTIGSPNIAAVDVDSLPRTTGGPAGGGSGTATGGDSRTLDAQGDAARAKGDYARAASLYTQAVERSPNDSEALGGLGDVARARGDFDGAKTSYRRALLANPQYLPAMIGLADVEYDSGDKATAQQTYKDIVERFPESAYPERVKDRGNPGASEAKTPKPAGSAAADNGAGAASASSVPPVSSASPPAAASATPTASSKSTAAPTDEEATP